MLAITSGWLAIDLLMAMVMATSYNWMGCAGSDHKRKYFPFEGGPYKCPQNASLDCAGWVDGARWQPPPLWDQLGR